MKFKATGIPYKQTNSFSKLALDYITGADALKPFYKYFPQPEMLAAAIKAKREQKLDRNLLSDTLLLQYEGLKTTELLLENIQLLKQADTFTITTAHQPNIFTGPFYFIYKILHAIKLAEYCKQQFPKNNFVPVYYMGSEDADLDELGHIFLNGEKLNWDTDQTGAVGRMKVDQHLLELIKRIQSEIGVLPFGVEIGAAVREFYTKDQTIQNATLGFVNYLFGRYGLVIVVPDNAALKSVSIDVFKDELLNQRSSAIVEKTIQQLDNAGYKVQAHGRDINLFYLKDDGERLRIEKEGECWKVLETDIQFNETELMDELQAHPERFSPNVILRGLFQEMILPNIAFIGGGGELAYWLELKNIFEHYEVAYPMLVLRNSFLVINDKQKKQVQKSGFEVNDLFKPLLGLHSQWVQKHSDNDVTVNKSLNELKSVFENLAEQATPIDTTLRSHIYALQKQTEKRIVEVGKKLLRAEKRNHTAAMHQIAKLKNQLFPNNNLQERIDNFLPYYAAWGPQFIDALYQHSYILEQEFVVLEEG